MTSTFTSEKQNVNINSPLKHCAYALRSSITVISGEIPTRPG